MHFISFSANENCALSYGTIFSSVTAELEGKVTPKKRCTTDVAYGRLATHVLRLFGALTH